MSTAPATPPKPLGTAVLFLVFNRPNTTARVFEAIRQARPPRLYVASDGPRQAKPGEDEVVAAVRMTVLEGVDWPCEVHTLLRDDNLGCKRAVSEAIGWFFAQEERGIVLEDDCVPSQSFFPFCEELLERYADDGTVGGITGDFRPVRGKAGPHAYGRVGYPLIWGWASWRRVWEQYDADLTSWTGDCGDFPRLAAKTKPIRRFMEAVLDEVKSGALDTWDFQLTFLCQVRGMDFLHPFVNLITNIGFDGDATHTSSARDPNAGLPRGEVRFPLQGPVEGRRYEHWLERHVFHLGGLRTRALNKLHRWSSSLLGRP